MLKISKWSATLLAMFCLGVPGLQAQAPTPAPSSSNTQSTEKRINYVRRLSLGVGVSVIVLDTINNGDKSITTTTPPASGNHSTTAVRKRVGYNGTLQVALTNRFAVTIGAVVRRVAFTRNGEVLSGVDNPTTAIDDRRYANIFEDTRARFIDIPVTVRYFGKNRTRPGHRWFLEGGVVQRNVSNVKSTVTTVLGAEEPGCCNPTKATNGVRGVIAGFGGQLIDPFGIRVVPSVRYTRWMGQTFNSFSTVSKKNQIEAMITIGF